VSGLFVFLLGLRGKDSETSGGHLSLLHRTGFAVRSDRVAQGFIQFEHENLQGWKLLGLSDQPVPPTD